LCTPGAWSLSLAAIEPGLCRYAIEAAALAQLQCRSTQQCDCRSDGRDDLERVEGAKWVSLPHKRHWDALLALVSDA
jgi:hypothetical protein